MNASSIQNPGSDRASAKWTESGPVASATHKLWTFSHVEIEKRVVWTDDYIKPKKKCSKYFACTNKETLVQSIVEVKKIVHCPCCGKLYLFVVSFKTKLLERPGFTKCVSHIFEVQPEDLLKAIDVDDYDFISCFSISYENVHFLSVEVQFYASN